MKRFVRHLRLDFCLLCGVRPEWYSTIAVALLPEGVVADYPMCDGCSRLVHGADQARRIEYFEEVEMRLRAIYRARPMG
jgi:hypothetical protein